MAKTKIDEDETMLTPSELGQVITALAALFGADDRAYLWSFGTLGNFSTPFTATEWLFANGVRPDEQEQNDGKDKD